MNKKTKRFIPFWIILIVAGILILVLGNIFSFPKWPLWLSSCICFGTAVIWILIHYILLIYGQKPKKTREFVGNKVVFNSVSKEINEAISRYLHSVQRKGFLKRSALYERPWFLVLGPKKCGKTQLLSGSGLDFPLKYPSEKDGMVLDEGSGISWNFGNNMVFADMPGNFMEDTGREEWKATVSAIHNIRSERTIDGVLVVVSADSIMKKDAPNLKTMSGSLRNRLDELIYAWGIEFPVYLIISKSDKIPGFKEIFHNPAGKWDEQLLGATISGVQQKDLPRQVFLVEFDLLLTSLYDMRLRMLAREKDEEKRRLICRFVIHFEGMQQKLGNLIAELFKPSSYEGKPVFSGFYFTSCNSITSSSSRMDSSMFGSISRTVVDHPLNPNKMTITKEHNSPVNKIVNVNSFFTYYLFRDIISTGTPLVKKTQRSTRREMRKHYGISAVIIIFAGLLGWYFYICSRNSMELNRKIKSDISVADKSNSLTETYRILGRMGDAIADLKQLDDNGVPWSMGMGMYKGDKIFIELKKKYFQNVKDLIVNPSMNYLEHQITKYSESEGFFTGDSYNALYDNLKAYLSISEAVANKRHLIDTVTLSYSLFDAIKYALLKSENKYRLSENVETVLRKNISLYLAYLRRGQFPLIQENQYLVENARSRLKRLPDAQTLYKMIITNLAPESTPITLDEILGRTGSKGFLLSKHSISTLYTQEGWDKSISTSIKDACKDPYKIDWVIGTTNDHMPERKLDLNKLYDDMVSLYFEDVQEKWIQFISSVTVEPFGDMGESGRCLLKLARDQSELVKFFSKVAELTQINEKADKVPEIPDGVNKVASKVVSEKVSRVTKINVRINPKSLMHRKKEQEKISSYFEPLRSFTKSDKGALAGLEGYRDKIFSLSEKITGLESYEGDNVVTLFNGKESDPLLKAWKFTNNELDGMPEHISLSIRKILLDPLEYTGKAISYVLVKQINELWNSDIYSVFSSSYAGKYPFLTKDDEALFDDVMNFFRPSTGVFWGFYDRRLSTFITKYNNRWKIRKTGSIEIGFNPAIFETFSKAEKIRVTFFQPDGTLRVQKVNMNSTRSSQNRALLKIGEKEFEIAPDGGDGAQFFWPNEVGSNDISLIIFAANSVAEEFAFKGQWGMLRLFEGSRYNILSPNSFIAKWHINVQNVYTIKFVCRINVSGVEHPFVGNLFKNFDCPSKIALVTD